MKHINFLLQNSFKSVLFNHVSRLCTEISLLPKTKISASTILTFKKELIYEVPSYLNVKTFNDQTFKCDFNVVLFNRPVNSNTFSNTVVFPGGILEKEDLNAEKWSFILNPTFFNKLKSFCIAPVYKEIKKRNEFCLSKCLSPFVALRICALREVFEETGFILAQDSLETENVCAYVLDLPELTIWKSQISKNPEKFSDLYLHFGLKPPITALIEWSNWSSPLTLKCNFDTIFYFVKIDSIKRFNTSDFKKSNNIEYNNSEVDTLFMDTPAAFLYSYLIGNKSKLQKIMPPQAFELGRLCHFSTILQLHAFASERTKFGSNCWRPIVIDFNLEYGKLFLLPGDERYKEVCHILKSNPNTTFSFDDFKSDQIRNRFFFNSELKSYRFDCNFYDLGHVTPITKDEYLLKFKV